MSFPEANLVKKTVTFRVMQVPDDPVMPKEALLRWICLSLGLISENESRDTVIRVFDVILSAQTKGKALTAEEVAEKMPEVSEKTVRYHLKRMEDMGVLEKNGKKYSLRRNPNLPSIELFTENFFSSAAEEASKPAKIVWQKLLRKYLD